MEDTHKLISKPIYLGYGMGSMEALSFQGSGFVGSAHSGSRSVPNSSYFPRAAPFSIQ